MDKKQLQEMREDFEETGKLPSHLQKIVDAQDAHKKKMEKLTGHKITEVVIPGMEWMSKISMFNRQAVAQELVEVTKLLTAESELLLGVDPEPRRELRNGEIKTAGSLVSGGSITRILSQISRLCKKGVLAKGNDTDSIAEINNLGDDLEKEVEKLMKLAGVTHRDKSFSPVSSALFEFTHSAYVAWDTQDYESYEWVLELLRDFSSKWEKWNQRLG